MPDGTFADRCLFYSERAVGDCSLMWRLHICRVPLWKRTVAFTFWRKYQLPKALLNSSNIVKQKLSTCIHFYLGRIFLADAEGSSDFFGNHDSSQIVHSSDNAGCFHISFSFSAAHKASPGGSFCAYNNFTNYAVSICKLTEIIPQYLHFKIAVI